MTVEEASLRVEQHTFPFFLSSLCKNPDDLWDLRARIFEDVGRGTLIYVDEKVKPRDLQRQEDLAAADDLVRRIREAGTFLCILAGSRHGSRIRVDSVHTSVSFLEVELFQAAMLGKDIRLFVRQDFSPEPALASLLHAFHFAFPEWGSMDAVSDNDIVSEIRKIVGKRYVTAVRREILRPPPLRRLVQSLYGLRARQRAAPSVLFLEGATISGKSASPDMNLLDKIARDLSSESHEEKRLARIWIGLREIMSSRPRDLADPDLLTYWNALLGEWARAGAWYGLHGDTALGCLAALNSLIEVRESLARARPTGDSTDSVAYPGGELASAKYSIAKKLYVRADRRARFHEALKDLQRTLATGRGDRSNLIAIRGSIAGQLGHHVDAVQDFETVLKLREGNNAPSYQIGEALSELGYAYLWAGQRRKGLDCCLTGVESMRQGHRTGFLARGLRKLAVAQALNLHFGKAYSAYQEARATARAAGAFDQVR